MTITASRYGTVAGAGGGTQTTQTTAPTQSNTNTSGSSATNQSGSTSGTSKTSTNQTVQNMDPQSQAALQLLIQQLMGGGTQQMAQQNAQRQQEIQYNQQVRSAYSPNAAFGDAQGAMAQQLRLAMEQVLPSITRASEGAGTSQNSLRALLVQKQAEEAAQSASALGLKAKVDYGNIGATLSSVLERLTAGADPVSSALLQALGIAKGATTTTKGTQTTSSDQQTNQQSQTNTNQQSQTNNSGTMTTQQTGFSNGGVSSGGGMSVMGNTNPAPAYNPTQSLVDMLDSAGAYSRQYTF